MKKLVMTLVALFAGICAVFASTPYEVTAKNSLNVRSGASSQSRVIGKLYHGDRVEVERVQGGWAEISYQGKIAYVSARYITVLPSSQSAAEPADTRTPGDCRRESDAAIAEREETKPTALESEYPTKGNWRLAEDGEIIKYNVFFGLQYNLMSFKSAKTSLYGIYVSAPSISHWGFFHLGAEMSMSFNMGIIDGGGVAIDFGPSMRFDISDKVFVNIPVNARVGKTYNSYDVNSDVSPEDQKESVTTWGAVIKPSLYFFPTDIFGLYIGPQLNISEKCAIGMQAGLALNFKL